MRIYERFFYFILKFLFVCFVIGIFFHAIYTSIEDIAWKYRRVNSENIHNNLTLIKEKEGNLIFFEKTDGSLVIVDKEYNLKKALNLSEKIEAHYEEERHVRRGKEAPENPDDYFLEE